MKMNIAEYLLRNKYSENIALICKGEQVTYKSLCSKTVEFVERLSCDGNNIGIYIPNSIEYVMAYFAILIKGKTVLPMNTSLKEVEIRHIVEFCEVKEIITIEKFRGIFEGLKLNISVLYIDEIKWRERKHDYSDLPYLTIDENETAMIIPTSGTTSTPKYVELSHKNLFVNTQEMLKIYNLKVGEKQLTLLPFCSAFSTTVDLLQSIFAGITMVIYSGIINVEQVFQTIEAERIDYSIMVPSVLRLMVSRYKSEKYDISSLKRISCGGEPLSSEDFDNIRKVWKNIVLIQGYGMTEASPVISTTTYRDYYLKPGTVGKVLPNLKIRIWDTENDRTVEAGKIGEVLVMGDSVMKGYYKMQEHSPVIDGWLHTGDLGYLDEDGYLFITGRIKNLIIVSGRNVNPEEVENVLMNCEQIKEAKVVGEKDKELGEFVTAYIVLEKSQVYDVAKIIKHCQNHLANYKIPKKFIVCDFLEKTITNKIRR